jgi:sugar phosphate isomerase/epimerase
VSGAPDPRGEGLGWPQARLGVHTHSLRALGEFDQALALLRAQRLSRVELWVGHADPRVPESGPAWREKLDAAGLRCDALGVVPFAGAPEEEAAFRLARDLGAGVITADFSLAAMPRVAAVVDAWAQAHGVAVAIHAHGAPHWLGNRAMLLDLLGRTSPAIGLCLDTFWAFDSREDAAALARAVGDRLLAVHLRDAVCLPDRSLLERPLGDGETGVRELLEVLRQRDFAGPVILESKDAPARVLPAAVERLRRGPQAFPRRDGAVQWG